MYVQSKVILWVNLGNPMCKGTSFGLPCRNKWKTISGHVHIVVKENLQTKSLGCNNLCQFPSWILLVVILPPNANMIESLQVLYKFSKKLVFVTFHNTIGASKVVKLLF
jgi:hypothetical protein